MMMVSALRHRRTRNNNKQTKLGTLGFGSSLYILLVRIVLILVIVVNTLHNSGEGLVNSYSTTTVNN